MTQVLKTASVTSLTDSISSEQEKSGYRNDEITRLAKESHEKLATVLPGLNSFMTTETYAGQARGQGRGARHYPVKCPEGGEIKSIDFEFKRHGGRRDQYIVYVLVAFKRAPYGLTSKFRTDLEDYAKKNHECIEYIEAEKLRVKSCEFKVGGDNENVPIVIVDKVKELMSAVQTILRHLSAPAS